MYGPNELDVWRRRREELAREAENGRLARRLRAERPKGVPRFESGIFESVHVPLPRRKGAT